MAPADTVPQSPPASDPAAQKSSEKADPGEPGPPAAQTAETPDEQKPTSAASAAAGTETTPADPPPESYEPLDKVADRIREELARERATARIDAIFTAVAADLATYAEERALWIARGDASVPEPSPPDVDIIAEKQGLEANRVESLTVAEAVVAGGIGGSFEFVPDPTSRFGIRQQRWLDVMFASGAALLRPVTSRDVEGNRYFSWKTADEPERVPSFGEARADVERAWRIIEARPLARKQAEELAARARDGSLSAAIEKDSTAPLSVGPFTWLTQGTVSLAAPPEISQPEGLSMPGESFMEAVFGAAPGSVVVAFNEPQTVCYVARVEKLDPDTGVLKERFAGSQGDQRRLALVAQEEFSDVFIDWIEGLERRYGLSWKRSPRQIGQN